MQATATKCLLVCKFKSDLWIVKSGYNQYFCINNGLHTEKVLNFETTFAHVCRAVFYEAPKRTKDERKLRKGKGDTHTSNSVSLVRIPLLPLAIFARLLSGLVSK